MGGRLRAKFNSSDRQRSLTKYRRVVSDRCNNKGGGHKTHRKHRYINYLQAGSELYRKGEANVALPAHEISIVINEMLINNQWPLTHREHEWPTNARASPLVEEAFRGTPLLPSGRREEKEVSFPRRVPTNACRFDERGDARAESSRFLRQPFAALAHTHTRIAIGRLTNQRGERIASSRFSTRFLAREHPPFIGLGVRRGRGARGRGSSRFTG